MPLPCAWQRRDEGGRRLRAGRRDRPLIDMKAVEKIEAHIADAVKKAPRSSSAASGPGAAAASSSLRVLTDVVITK
jgi:hypothetical protein